MFQFISMIFCLALAAVQLGAQEEPALLRRASTGSYSIVERSDWSRYVNGKYTGLTHREVHGFLNQSINTDTEAFSYWGNFFVLEETLRDMRHNAKPVDAIVNVSFEIHPNGRLYLNNDTGFPSLRGFPAFPSEAVFPGTTWKAPADRAVDPLNSGKPVLVPFTAEYEYKGVEQYRGIPVHRILARYPSSYRGEFRIQGSHTVDILIQVSDGLPLMMKDTLDETFFFDDGSTLRFRGFTLTFGQHAVPLNRDQVITTIRRTLLLPEPERAAPAEKEPVLTEASPPQPAPKPDLEIESSPDIEIASVPEGVKLLINDLQFTADSDQLLLSERKRLDDIAAILRQVSDRSFLVEGHTAAASESSGVQLSELRAKRIVDEMVSRGLSINRFIYKGWGSSKPIASNTTEAGRSRNRRVEITILDLSITSAD
ncbi:MAG: OmpA family protein [Spirochaetaceae bacterium]|jgi:outer membrane protein OmpA-like peptidoglycan-associated protein|nr:OmpA family protein [Spirochaetaceae bacterium]